MHAGFAQLSHIVVSSLSKLCADTPCFVNFTSLKTSFRSFDARSPVRSHSRLLSGVKPFANSLLGGLHGGEKRRLEVFLLVRPVIRLFGTQATEL